MEWIYWWIYKLLQSCNFAKKIAIFWGNKAQKFKFFYNLYNVFLFNLNFNGFTSSKGRPRRVQPGHIPACL